MLLSQSETGNISSGMKDVIDVSAFVINVPMILVGIKMVKDAAAIHLNLQKKEFKSNIIKPGERSHGFVYFKLSNPNDINRKLYLSLNALELRSKKKIKLQL